MNVIVIEDRVRIPSGLNSLEAYRQWARSDEYPERGRFSYLNGEMWVDLSMGQLFSHNGVKTQFTVILGRPDGSAGRLLLFRRHLMEQCRG